MRFAPNARACPPTSRGRASAHSPTRCSTRTPRCAPRSIISGGSSCSRPACGGRIRDGSVPWAPVVASPTAAGCSTPCPNATLITTSRPTRSPARPRRSRQRASNGGRMRLPTILHAVAGDRLLSVRKSADTSVVLFDQSVTVTTGRSITVFATGIGTDVAALVLPDEDGIPINGAIRVLNASPTMGPADVYITDPGADLSTATPVASNLAFRAISGTAFLSGGQVRFTTPGTTTVVLTGPTLTLTSGQIRTVVALDAPGGGTPLTTATLVDRSVVGR